MPIEDARKLVAKMKEDSEFRRKVAQAIDPDELDLFLRGEGMLLNQQDLVRAMAECMAQMEQQMKG